MRTRCALGFVLIHTFIACRGGDDGIDPAVGCDEGYVALSNAQSGLEDEFDELLLCISQTDAPATVETKSVEVLRVQARTGFADISIAFPSLRASREISISGCGFSAISFPMLAQVDSLVLNCEDKDAGFVVDAPALSVIQRVFATGSASLRLPAVAVIGEVRLENISDFELETAEAASVDDFHVYGGRLDQFAAQHVASVDHLDLSSNIGDLLAGAFAGLRSAATIDFRYNFQLTQCSIDRLLSQLSVPPSQVRLDGALDGPCSQ